MFGDPPEGVGASSSVSPEGPEGLEDLGVRLDTTEVYGTAHCVVVVGSRVSGLTSPCGCVRCSGGLKVEVTPRPGGRDVTIHLNLSIRDTCVGVGDCSVIPGPVLCSRVLQSPVQTDSQVGWVPGFVGPVDRRSRNMSVLWSRDSMCSTPRPVHLRSSPVPADSSGGGGPSGSSSG